MSDGLNDMRCGYCGRTIGHAPNCQRPELCPHGKYKGACVDCRVDALVSALAAETKRREEISDTLLATKTAADAVVEERDLLRTDNARLREALQECCGVLDHVRDRLGICGPGDGGDRRADADDLWGINIAMDTARIALNHEPEREKKDD